MAKGRLGGRDRRTPLSSPLYAGLSGLLPRLIQVGSAEPLLDDATRLTERARTVGVDVTLQVWNDMPHVWHMFAPILPEGQRTSERIGEFMREHTGRIRVKSYGEERCPWIDPTLSKTLANGNGSKR